MHTVGVASFVHLCSRIRSVMARSPSNEFCFHNSFYAAELVLWLKEDVSLWSMCSMFHGLRL